MGELLQDQEERGGDEEEHGDGQPGDGPVRGSPLRPSDETIDYFRDEEDLRSCTDLGRLERAYRTAVRRMDDYETGRRGDYAGHLWHGAANDAYAILSRIEESGLFRAAGYEDMETYSATRRELDLAEFGGADKSPRGPEDDGPDRDAC